MIHFLLPDRWGARESVTLNLPPQPRKRSAPSQLPKSPGGAAPSGGGLRGGVGVGSRGFSSKGPPLGAGRCWRILQLPVSWEQAGAQGKERPSCPQIRGQ